jgi:D-3-phosphoglycerate dehydrogenase
MKILCIGDNMITPDMMKSCMGDYPEYDEVKYFFFGPDNRTGLMAHIKQIEAKGSLATPVPDEVMAEVEDADVIQTHMCPLPASLFEKAK